MIGKRNLNGGGVRLLMLLRKRMAPDYLAAIIIVADTVHDHRRRTVANDTSRPLSYLVDVPEDDG